MRLPCDNNGVNVADKTDMQNIYDVYEYSETDAVFCIHIKNNLGYFGMKASGLQAIDISNTLEPVDYGNIESISNITNIESTTDYLYCSVEYDTLIHIVDIVDPYNPLKTGEIPIYHGWVNDYCIDQNRLFLLDSSSYLELYDLTIPDSPNLVSIFQENGNCLAVKDSFLLIGELFGSSPIESKIKLLKIEDDYNITLIDEMIFDELSLYGIKKIEIDFPYFYVCSRAGLGVLTITNNKLSICDELIWSEGYSYMTDMVIDSNYVYLAGTFYGQGLVNIIDKNNPYDLTILQTVNDYINKLTIKNNYLFGAITYSGYYVYGDGITGFDFTESQEDDLIINCYPNPCTNMTTINFRKLKERPQRLEIFNLLGAKIFETDIKNKDHMVIETRNFKSGIFIIKLLAVDKTYTHKIIVKR